MMVMMVSLNSFSDLRESRGCHPPTTACPLVRVRFSLPFYDFFSLLLDIPVNLRTELLVVALQVSIAVLTNEAPARASRQEHILSVANSVCCLERLQKLLQKLQDTRKNSSGCLKKRHGQVHLSAPFLANADAPNFPALKQKAYLYT